TSRQFLKSSTSRWKASLSPSPASPSSSVAWPIRSSARLARLMSTSSTGPCPHHSLTRCPSTRASSPRRSRYSVRGSTAPCTSTATVAIRCASPRPGCRRRSGGGRSCSPPARTARPPRQGRWRRSRPRARPTGSPLRGAACRCRAHGGARAPRQEHERCQRGDAKDRPWHGRRLPRAASHCSRGLPCPALLFMSRGSFAHPGTILPGVAARLHPLLGDGAFAAHDRVEFLPVDLAEVVAVLLLVPLERGVGNLEAEEVSLRHRDVDELLPKLVIGLALDPPAHRLRGVRAVGIGRTEHHQARPPPAVERVLRHALLLGRAVRKRDHDLVALALVKALFLADADHR